MNLPKPEWDDSKLLEAWKEIIDWEKTGILCDKVVRGFAREWGNITGVPHHYAITVAKDLINKELAKRYIKAAPILEDATRTLKEWEELFGPILDFAISNSEPLGIRLGDSIAKYILDMLKDKAVGGKK